MYCTHTASPCADAERYYDAIEEAGAAQEQADRVAAIRLADEFVSAAACGEDEHLGRFAFREALYEVTHSDPEILDKIFYRAAQLEDRTLRALLVEMGDAWAAIKLSEAAKKGPFQ